MGLIYLRNVFQKEVITFSRLWEENTQDKAQLLIREKKMGATEDQDFTEDTSSDEKYEELNS